MGLKHVGEMAMAGMSIDRLDEVGYSQQWEDEPIVQGQIAKLLDAVCGSLVISSKEGGTAGGISKTRVSQLIVNPLGEQTTRSHNPLDTGDLSHFRRIGQFPQIAVCNTRDLTLSTFNRELDRV